MDQEFTSNCDYFEGQLISLVQIKEIAEGEMKVFFCLVNFPHFSWN